MRRSSATSAEVGSATVVATIARIPSVQATSEPRARSTWTRSIGSPARMSAASTRSSAPASASSRARAFEDVRAASISPEGPVTTASTTSVETPTSSVRAAVASMPAPEASKLPRCERSGARSTASSASGARTSRRWSPSSRSPRSSR